MPQLIRTCRRPRAQTWPVFLAASSASLVANSGAQWSSHDQVKQFTFTRNDRSPGAILQALFQGLAASLGKGPRVPFFTPASHVAPLPHNWFTPVKAKLHLAPVDNHLSAKHGEPCPDVAAANVGKLVVVEWAWASRSFPKLLSSFLPPSMLLHLGKARVGQSLSAASAGGLCPKSRGRSASRHLNAKRRQVLGGELA